MDVPRRGGRSLLARRLLPFWWVGLLPACGGGGWQLLAVTGSPHARAGHAMAFNPDQGRVTLPDERCDDGIDDDGDGLVDCADPDCNGQRCGSGRCAAGTCQ